MYFLFICKITTSFLPNGCTASARSPIRVQFSDPATLTSPRRPTCSASPSGSSSAQLHHNVMLRAHARPSSLAATKRLRRRPTLLVIIKSTDRTAHIKQFCNSERQCVPEGTTDLSKCNVGTVPTPTTLKLASDTASAGCKEAACPCEMAPRLQPVENAKSFTNHDV